MSVGGAEPMIDELRAGVVRTAQYPLQKRLESATLRIGEPFTGDVLLSDILGPLMTPTRTPESGQSRDPIAADLTTASTCKAHPFVAPRIIEPANTKASYSLWCQ